MIVAVVWILNVPLRLMCERLDPQPVALLEVGTFRRWDIGDIGKLGHWGYTLEGIWSPSFPLSLFAS